MDTVQTINQCVFCKSVIKPINLNDRMMYYYVCEVCGKISISFEAVMDNYSGISKPLENRHFISGFTRNRTERGLPPIDISNSNINELIKGINVPSNISDKLDRILLYFEKNSAYPGDIIHFDSKTLYPIAYAQNKEEFDFLLSQLRDLKYVEFPAKGEVLLTLEGWNYLVQIHRSPRVTTQVFVAMWFNTKTEKAYSEGIEKAINECGFIPVRVDKLEHNNKICDMIISEIRRSAFLVADFTGHRGGVYFEAGYAMGLGIPVIWLCHKDEIDDAHFDTRQYNHITWDSENDLYERLLNRIRATMI